MFTRKSSARRVFYALSGALLLSMGLGHQAIAQNAQQMTPEQRAAVKVVKEWFAAWNTKDPAKVASYLSPNVEFRSGAGSPICHGPGPIMTRYKFIGIVEDHGGATIKDIQAYAVQDGNADLHGRRAPTPESSPYAPSKDAIPVLSVRIDEFKGPPAHSLLISAFFLVNNGKIEMFWEEPGQSPVPGRPPETCARGL